MVPDAQGELVRASASQIAVIPKQGISRLGVTLISLVMIAMLAVAVRFVLKLRSAK